MVWQTTRAVFLLPSAFVFLLILLLPTTPVGAQTPQESLNAARQQWTTTISEALSATVNLTNRYQYAWTETFGTDEEPTRFVKVDNGIVTDVTTARNYQAPAITNNVSDYQTIEELFDRIQAFIDSPTTDDDMLVTYNETLGYPMELQILEASTAPETNNKPKVLYSAKIEWLTPYLLLQAELNAHMLQWETNKPPDYWYAVQPFCFCGSDYVQPKVVWVLNHTVEEIVLEETGELYNSTVVPSIATIFEDVQMAIDRDYPHIQVVYDPTYGYIQRFSINFGDDVADGGKSVTISRFEISSEAPVVPLLPPGKEAAVAKNTDALETARAQWALHNTDHYLYVYQLECNTCVGFYTDPYIVRVRNQQVENITHRFNTSAPVRQEIVTRTTTIEGLFLQIDEALNKEEADVVQVTYDEEYGYPLSVYIDYKKDWKNEELMYTINSFHSPSSDQDVLDTRLATMVKANLTTYTYTYRASCRCPTSTAFAYTVRASCDCRYGNLDMLVTVVNGTIVSVEESEIILAPTDVGDIWTLQELMTVIQEALNQDAFEVYVEYDPIFGYPTSVFIDYDDQFIFEEIRVSTELLTVDNQTVSEVMNLLPPPEKEEDATKLNQTATDDSMAPTALAASAQPSLRPSSAPSASREPTAMPTPTSSPTSLVASSLNSLARSDGTSLWSSGGSGSLWLVGTLLVAVVQGWH